MASIFSRGERVKSAYLADEDPWLNFEKMATCNKYIEDRELRHKSSFCIVQYNSYPIYNSFFILDLLSNFFTLPFSLDFLQIINSLIYNRSLFFLRYACTGHGCYSEIAHTAKCNGLSF